MKKCSKRIILGSGSPRRRELLAGLDIDFTVDTGNTFEESVPEGAEPSEVPLLMALGKSHGFHRLLEDDELLITADTVVAHKGQVLGKPRDREEAEQMLRSLSGDSHKVYTGVCIKSAARHVVFTEQTTVVFRQLSDEIINTYINQGTCFDKAGAYGIQEWIGMVGVERIEGCYYNVRGLPLARLYDELLAFVRKP